MQASQWEEDTKNTHISTPLKQESGNQKSCYHKYDELDNEYIMAMEGDINRVTIKDGWLVIQRNNLMGKDNNYEGRPPFVN